VKDAEVVEYTGGDPPPEHGFGLQITLTTVTTNEPKWFASSSAQDLIAWREALKQAKLQEPSQAPVRARIPRSQRTNNTLFRAKKRAATVVGVPVMRKLFGENIRLLDTVKQIVAKHIDQDTAKRVYNLLIRLIFKINFQFEKKKPYTGIAC